MSNPFPVVRLTQLTRSFEQGGVRIDVLRGVDLSVQPGEVVALLGRNQPLGVLAAALSLAPVAARLAELASEIAHHNELYHGDDAPDDLGDHVQIMGVDIGQGDFDLGLFSERPEHAHALDFALGPEQRDLLSSKAGDGNHRSLSVANPASASTIAMIQNRITICDSVQPSCSK